MFVPFHFSRQTVFVAITGLVAIAICVIDIVTPPWLHVWILYMPVILSPVWFGNSRQIVGLLVLCSLLLVMSSWKHPLGVSIWSDVVNPAKDLLALALTGFAGVTIARRNNQLAAAMEKLRLETAHRELLEREVLEIATREQMRIGQELHDSVGQELTGLGLMADALSQRLAEETGQRTIATKLVAGVDRLHRQVRGLSRGLVPVHVESHGLWAALDDLASGSTEQTGVMVTLESESECELVDHHRATELFRIAQEAVSNALRHGRPHRVSISFLRVPDGLRLAIEDDGTGISRAAAPSPGMGLRIMEHRAQQIGAAFKIGPAPGGGTIVSCVLPAEQTSQATPEQFTHAKAG